MTSGLRSRALWAAVAAGMLWLGGCGGGSKSAAGLRTVSHKAYSFDVAADYRTVYERILLRARKRYAFAGISRSQPGVSAELSPESQSGTITLWDSGGIGIRYRLSAEIQAIDPGRTRVDLYAAGKNDPRRSPPVGRLGRYSTGKLNCLIARAHAQASLGHATPKLRSCPGPKTRSDHGQDPWTPLSPSPNVRGSHSGAGR